MEAAKALAHVHQREPKAEFECGAQVCGPRPRFEVRQGRLEYDLQDDLVGRFGGGQD